MCRSGGVIFGATKGLFANFGGGFGSSFSGGFVLFCAPFPGRSALLSVATFANCASRLKGIASFSSFTGSADGSGLFAVVFCSADAFAINPFFFEYDNAGFESFPFAVQFVCGLQEMEARKLVGRQVEGLVFVMLRVCGRPRRIKKDVTLLHEGHLLY